MPAMCPGMRPPMCPGMRPPMTPPLGALSLVPREVILTLVLQWRGKTYENMQEVSWGWDHAGGAVYT